MQPSGDFYNLTDLVMRPRARHYLAAGVRPDVEQILTDFTALNSLRYEDFAILWCEKKVSFIYSGRDSEMELREFTEEVLRITADFLVPPYSFQVQVGAVYLLYGFYFKQPNNPRSRIRLTMATWEHVQSFLGEVYEQQHLDVAFIFLKLEHARAFDFVAHTTQVPALRIRQLEDDREQGIDQRQRILSMDRPELTDVINLSEMANIHLRYYQMKVALAPEGATKPHSSLDVIENDIVDSITQTIVKHERWRARKIGEERPSKSADDGVMEDADVPDQAMCDTVGTRRAMLKERAYQSIPQGGWRLQRRSNPADGLAGDGSPLLEGCSEESSEDIMAQDTLVGPAEDSHKAKLPRGKRRITTAEENTEQYELEEDDSYSPSKCRSRGRGRGRGKGRGRGRGKIAPVPQGRGESRVWKRGKGSVKKK